MRIDGIGIQKTGAQAAQSPAPLETGDVLTADVQKAEGDAVVLRTSDGRLLNARLAENAALAQNDRVEFIVAQSGREGIVLRIVYVEPRTADNAAQTAAGAAEAALLEAFEQAGVKPDARTLASALSLMRQNGLTPKAALFFALNRMEITPERLAAYQALTSGQGPGETLYGAAQTLISLLGGPAAEGARQTQPGGAQQPQQAQSGQDAAPPQAGESAPAAQNENPEPTSGTAQNTANEAAAPARAQAQGAQAQGAQAQGDAARTTEGNMPQSTAQIISESAAQPGQTAETPQAQRQPQPAGTTQAQQPRQARGGQDAAPPQAGGGTPAAQNEVGMPAPDAARSIAENVAAAPARGQGGAARAEGENVPQGAAGGGAARADITPETPQSEGPRIPAQPARSENAQPAILDTAAQAAVPGGGGAALSAQAELRELPSRILSLFLELTGGEDAEDIKKFVSESNGRLGALKFTAGKYDEESMRTELKQLVQPQLERAQAQAKLAQDVTRFVCYQLPVYSGEYGTGELYVYRRAKSKGAIDADNASVLISIPTESFGRVETLLRTENRSLSVSFSVERESGVDALKEGVRELRKTLSAKTPYRLGEMRVGPLTERTTVENAEAVLNGGARKNVASIDVKI